MAVLLFETPLAKRNSANDRVPNDYEQCTRHELV
jgi:hypothetical protein